IDQCCQVHLSVSPRKLCWHQPFRTAKFNSVSSLTLFFPASQGADTSDTTRIYYVGFFGHWTTRSFPQRKSNPAITVCETQANLVDHERIQGTDGNFS
ncbi:hypothetical protein F4604DRAFT_2010836, partial [Suillus subluteus]